MSDILTILQDAERDNMTGNKNAAIKKYSIIASMLPLVASALFNRGVCYHYIGQLDAARDDILKSACIDTKYYSLARNEGLGKYVEDLSENVINLNTDANAINVEDFGENRATFWPDGMNINSISDFYRATVKKIIAAIPNVEAFIDRSSVIMTFGSCFAVNLGRALVARGFNVENTLIPEDVNGR
jgi:tetratricopeptide (TPR) repeat protein